VVVSSRKILLLTPVHLSRTPVDLTSGLQIFDNLVVKVDGIFAWARLLVTSVR